MSLTQQEIIDQIQTANAVKKDWENYARCYSQPPAEVTERIAKIVEARERLVNEGCPIPEHLLVWRRDMYASAPPPRPETFNEFKARMREVCEYDPVKLHNWWTWEDGTTAFEEFEVNRAGSPVPTGAFAHRKPPANEYQRLQVVRAFWVHMLETAEQEYRSYKERALQWVSNAL